MGEALQWEREGRDWPHRDTSRFVRAGGLHWHVQRMGNGPTMLLIHGTGATTHSWRALMPLLARERSVVAMDLPGHGFTTTPAPDGLSLPAMARAVAALVQTLALDVDLVVGHSAGAAIAARMLLDASLRPCGLASINGALLPFGGLAGLLFPPVARLIAATPLTSRLFARRSWQQADVERLIGGTGSSLDPEGVALYARLVRNPCHVAGALGMMAHWNLRPLERDLARLATPLHFIVGANDRAVPPAVAERVRALLPRSTATSHHVVPAAGHLVHEERPEAVARLLLAAKAQWPAPTSG